MTARGNLRGHAILWDTGNGEWLYADTMEPTVETWQQRPCGYCGQPQTPEGHDACLGALPGVMNACCGHGDDGEAYIQWVDGSSIRGAAAVLQFRSLREQ